MQEAYVLYAYVYVLHSYQKGQEKQRIEYILRRNNAVKPKLISIVFLSFSSFIIIHKEQEDEYDAHSENVSSMSSQYEQGDAAATSLIVWRK